MRELELEKKVREFEKSEEFQQYLKNKEVVDATREALGMLEAIKKGCTDAVAAYEKAFEPLGKDLQKVSVELFNVAVETHLHVACQFVTNSFEDFVAEVQGYEEEEEEGTEEEEENEGSWLLEGTLDELVALFKEMNK